MSSTELERKDRVIASLKRVIVESDKANRRKQISSILNGVKFFKSEKERDHFIDIWEKSDVSTDEIAKIYNEILTARPNSNSMYK